MFENIRARIKKLEEDHESIHKAKLHVEKYQLVYAAAGSSVLTLVAVRTFGGPQVIVREAANLPAVINNTVAPVFNNENVGNQLVNNGGHMRKIVRCLETDELWPSMSKAAEAAGHSLTRMSDQIHGRTDHLDGLHYVIEGLSAS
jgi:hypothetical protein